MSDYFEGIAERSHSFFVETISVPLIFRSVDGCGDIVIVIGTYLCSGDFDQSLSKELFFLC